MTNIFQKALSVMVLSSLCLSGCANSGIDRETGASEGGQTDIPEVTGDGGYLFAHMTDSSYGRLFYSVSRDGWEWTTLNNGQIILNDYIGHPDIWQGPDGIYYMIGLFKTGPGMPILWMSEDLVVWKRKNLNLDVFDVSQLGYKNEGYLGAPKIFYDEASGQWIITWHAPLAKYTLGTQQAWESMATMYIMTSDFETFTSPRKLFDWNNDGAVDFSGNDATIATIDVIIRKTGEKYYAIIKDERWPETVATGKCIRIASSDALLGPYSDPGEPVCPAWREAPTLVHDADGNWRIYVEKYPDNYECYMSSDINSGKWEEVKFEPPYARHGCILRIDEKTYKKIVESFPGK